MTDNLLDKAKKAVHDVSEEARKKARKVEGEADKLKER